MIVDMMSYLDCFNVIVVGFSFGWCRSFDMQSL